MAPQTVTARAHRKRSRPERARLSVLVLLTTLVLAACAAPATQSPGAVSSTGAPTQAVEQQPAVAVTATAATDGGATEGASTSAMITIGTPEDAEALQFRPSRVTAPPNAVVTVTFINSSILSHNLSFRPPIVDRTKLVVKPGESDTFTFTTPASGTFQFLSTLYEGVMFGTLEVK